MHGGTNPVQLAGAAQAPKAFSLRSPGVREAYVVSWVSMVCTVLAFLVGLIVALSTASASTLGFALENAVDSFSSALVLWRFWGGGESVPEAVLATREKRASVGIAIAFIVLAVVVGSVAISHLSHEEAPSDVGALIGLSTPSMIVFLVLGVIKLHIGQETRSPSMRKDGLCSLCGALLSLGVLIGAGVVSGDKNGWWIDAAVAVVVSAGLLLYGVYTLWKNARQGNEWWTAAFWCVAPPHVTRRAEHAPPIDTAGVTVVPC